MFRYRLRTLLILAGLLPIPLAMFSDNFLTLPLRESDRIEATQTLMAWILEDRRVPGFDEPIVNGNVTRKKKSFDVVCNFVPTGTELSKDARVRLVPRLEAWHLREKRDDPKGYIQIALQSESRWLLVIEFENDYGRENGAQCYRFEFRRKVWGLRGRGELLWDY